MATSLDIITRVRGFRAALIARDDQALAAVATTYTRIGRACDQHINRLTSQIMAATHHGERVPITWLYERGRLQALRRDIDREVRTRLPELQGIISGHAEAAAASGLDDGLDLIRAATGAPLRHQGLDVQRAIVAASQARALPRLLTDLPEHAANVVARTLEKGVILGRNPHVIAREMTQALGGNRARAQTIARTEALRAYREATRVTWRDTRVVHRWQWFSTLDRTACPVCWAMHGTLHPISEPMGSHPSCRCTMVPVVDGADPPITRTGAEVFEQDTPYSTQRALLGPGKHDAYLQGRLRLPDLVAKDRDPRWGLVRRERSIADALANTMGRHNAPAPTPLTPTTVSGRLHDAWPTRATTTPTMSRHIARALEQMDDAGLDVPPGWTPTPITSTHLGPRVNGEFSPRLRSIEITTAHRMDPLQTAAVIHHEIGHSIDQITPGIRSYKSEAGAPNPWGRFTDVANRSPHVVRLRELRAEAEARARDRTASPVDRRIARSFRDHLDYLLRPREIWARAFAQWVAEQASPETTRRMTSGDLGGHAPNRFTTQWKRREWWVISPHVRAVLEAEQFITTKGQP